MHTTPISKFYIFNSNHTKFFNVNILKQLYKHKHLFKHSTMEDINEPMVLRVAKRTTHQEYLTHLIGLVQGLDVPEQIALPFDPYQPKDPSGCIAYIQLKQAQKAGLASLIEVDDKEIGLFGIVEATISQSAKTSLQQEWMIKIPSLCHHLDPDGRRSRTWWLYRGFTSVLDSSKNALLNCKPEKRETESCRRKNCRNKAKSMNVLQGIAETIEEPSQDGAAFVQSLQPAELFCQSYLEFMVSSGNLSVPKSMYNADCKTYFDAMTARLKPSELSLCPWSSTTNLNYGSAIAFLQFKEAEKIGGATLVSNGNTNDGLFGTVQITLSVTIKHTLHEKWLIKIPSWLGTQSPSLGQCKTWWRNKGFRCKANKDFQQDVVLTFDAELLQHMKNRKRLCGQDTTKNSQEPSDSTKMDFASVVKHSVASVEEPSFGALEPWSDDALLQLSTFDQDDSENIDETELLPENDIGMFDAAAFESISHRFDFDQQGSLVCNEQDMDANHSNSRKKTGRNEFLQEYERLMGRLDAKTQSKLPWINSLLDQNFSYAKSVVYLQLVEANKNNQVLIQSSDNIKDGIYGIVVITILPSCDQSDWAIKTCSGVKNDRIEYRKRHIWWWRQGFRGNISKDSGGCEIFTLHYDKETRIKNLENGKRDNHKKRKRASNNFPTDESKSMPFSKSVEDDSDFLISYMESLEEP
jgi:hypothetical protein